MHNLIKLFTVLLLVVGFGSPSFSKPVYDHPQESSTPFMVKTLDTIESINPDNSINLSSGGTVVLYGVETASNPKLNRFLNSILIGSKVISAPQSFNNPSVVNIYLWDADRAAIERLIKKDTIVNQEFLNVDGGYGGTRKGLAIFLNATLIKSGLASPND